MAKRRDSWRKRKRAQVRAAGGVILREHPKKGLQVVVIHRPRYDDWSLPKGKLNRGERWKAAALREVHEETGIRCRIGAELSSSCYRVGKRRKRKLIRWFVMEPRSKNGKAKFEPSEEVDERRWVTLGKAEKLLDYPDERELVRDAAARRG